jgi:hypothetical protein
MMNYRRPKIRLKMFRGTTLRDSKWRSQLVPTTVNASGTVNKNTNLLR